MLLLSSVSSCSSLYSLLLYAVALSLLPLLAVEAGRGRPEERSSSGSVSIHETIVLSCLQCG